MGELLKELTDQIKELKNQVAQSNARIDELEQRLKEKHEKETVATLPTSPQTPQTATTHAQSSQIADKIEDSKPVVTAGDTKRSFKIPGTNTSLGIGGYVKLDTLFSSTGMGEDTDGNQRLDVYEIPVTSLPSGDKNQVTFHAKETRFWIKSFTPSGLGDINTHVEMDFFGSPKLYTYTPRLRHAYGTLGQLLVGQTWTTFFNSLVLAETLDFGKTVGSPMILRQPEIRWSQPFFIGELLMEWQFAAEAPNNYIWDLDNGSITKISNSHYPDLITRFNFLPNWGGLSLAAMARQISYTPATLNQEISLWGGAVSLGGKINTFGADNIRFFLSYGNPLGRYGPNTLFADAAVDSAGNMNLITAYSGMLSYQHWWNSTWHSNLVYGIAHADQPGFAATANSLGQSLHANLLWTPSEQTMIGIEYIYGMRELVNGQNGDLNRIQFSTRFSF